MLVTLEPGGDPVAAVRAAAGSVVLVARAGDDPLAEAWLRACLEPLAVERTPERVNAVLAHADAEEGAIAAAAAFLERAPSTTGQLIELGQPRERVQGPSAATTTR